MAGASALEDSPRVRPEFQRFNWRCSTAEYVLHKKMMPDYFRSYVHALASYRGVVEESLDALRCRLVSLSESPGPSGGFMPPNISGMVRNLAHKLPSFDLRSLLSERSDLFALLDKEKVRYLGTTSKEESSASLSLILVEGLFLYFLAKFYHYNEFPLKISYYSRSEPVKTALLYATGCKGIRSALSTYFSLYPEVFTVDEDLSSLKLTKSYFDPSFRGTLRRYMEQAEHAQNIEEEEADVSTMGIVSSVADPYSLLIDFLHFPHVPPAVLNLTRRNKSLSEGTKIWIKARNAGNAREPSWIVDSYSLKGQEVPQAAGPPPPNLLEGVPGKIRSILSPSSAVVRFNLQDSEAEAFLHVGTTCFEGLGCGLGLPLNVYFRTEDPVIFDACRIGQSYRVCRIALDVSRKSVSSEHDVLRRIEGYLGGRPRLPDPAEGLVLSVLRWGTLDVVPPKFLLDVPVVDHVFTLLSNSGVNENKEGFLTAFENLARKLFAKMLLDYNMDRFLTSTSSS